MFYGACELGFVKFKFENLFHFLNKYKKFWFFNLDNHRYKKFLILALPNLNVYKFILSGDINLGLPSLE